MSYIVVVRGTLKSGDERDSRKVHDATMEMLGQAGKEMGNTGHRAYLKAGERQEFLAIDTWSNLEGPQKLLANPDLAAEFGKLFDGRPEVAIYEQTDWTGW